VHHFERSDANANVALASAGAVASASSTAGPGFPVAAVNDGLRAGTHWKNGGGWMDATPLMYPDWIQINFSGTKTIDRAVVYTLQDDENNPIEPTDTLTFSRSGICDFSVQGWNGSTWITLATVTGNNLVKRTVTFAPFTTDRIRVSVTKALGWNSRITEIEAFSAVAGGLSPTATRLTSSTDASVIGELVTFTATVILGSNPTGTVRFSVNNVDATIPECSAIPLTGVDNTRTAVCKTKASPSDPMPSWPASAATPETWHQSATRRLL
jgi:hypothetical protein